MPHDEALRRLEHMKSKLLDLSLRNKLLNYRPGRSSAVPVVGEVPRVVVRRLLGDEESFGFLPKPDGEPAPDAGEEFAPLPDEELKPHQKDRMLQTALTAKELEKALYNLFLKSRTSFEEQGAVTLFLAVGMLEWYESPSETDSHVAPILLVPVILSRKGVGRPYRLKAAPEEAAVNPSLLRKLAVDFGAEPALPETENGPDPDAVLEAFTKCLPDPRFKVLTDIHLGLFSFSKYLMYHDLEVQSDALLGNRLVARLAGEEPEEEEPDLPEAGDLDRLRHPEQVHQILDADSSQQLAIEAVLRGGDLVLEGPPGTGKSQTIANLIAESLAVGRTVLFVSEKMAALEVVKRRLDHAGLGDYVLELHSRHAAKREVVRELKRCLDRERHPGTDDREDLDRLVRVRDELAAYLRELHEPFGEGGLTPYETFGLLAELAGTRDVVFPVDRPEDLEPDERDRRERLVADLARARGKIAPAGEHPFRHSRLTDVPRAVEVELRKLLRTFGERHEALRRTVGEEAEELSIEPPADLAAARTLGDLLAHLERSPHPEAAWVLDPAWPGATPEGKALVAKGRKHAAGLSELRKAWKPELFDLALDDLAARRAEHGTGFFRIFRPAWWRDRKLLRSVRRPGASRTNAEEIDDLALAVRVRDLGGEIDAAAVRAADDYGRIWNGRETDWDGLEEVGAWIARLRTLCPGGRASEAVAEEAAGGRDLERRTARVAAALDEATAELGRLRDLLRARDLPEGLADLGRFVEAAESGFETVHDQAKYRRALETAREADLVAYLETADREGLSTDELLPCYRKAFAGAILDRVRAERPALGGFDGRRHEDRIARFRELDESQLSLAARRIRASLDAELPGNRSFSPKSDVGLLLREAAKKRRHLPIRKLLERAGEAVRRIKPCFMMSPISVAQFLPVQSEPFDLVVFDEASQICPEDAIGALARGRRLVVVGDSKQLPPTSFFSYDPDLEADEDEEEPLPDLESILDLCAASGFPRSRLKWHYRSRDESLIAFSNHHFYDGSLYTFPGPGGRPGLGVSFHHVEDGIYDRGATRQNREEARRVARAVAEQIRAEPELSVGTVTFSQAQQLAVLEELDRLCREDPELDELLHARPEEPAFVKNLENVQGDERDVMFFSVGYGRDKGGKLTMNFGPLNGDGGHRRLNVAVTRARRAVRVFSSILPDDIDPNRATGRGARLLRSYLEYARRGPESLGIEAPAPSDESGGSRFEEAVAAALEKEGLAVERHVGSSAYRMDLAVARDGRYVLGVECDGPTYRDAKTVRDRDRTRGQVLTGLGWTVRRAWSADWVRAPGRETERLVSSIAESPPDSVAASAQNPVAVPVPEPESRPERRDEPEEDDAPLPATPSYARTPLAPGRPFDAEDPGLPDLVAEVVEFEGPVHPAEIARRLADAFDVRLTRKVREAVEAATEGALRDGHVERRGDFLWRPGESACSLRGPAEDGSTRRVEHVPDEEIADGVRLILQVDLRMPREPLVKSVGRLLGHRRPGEASLARIDGVIESLLALGLLEESKGRLRYAD